ncbi:hypothetical protein [Methylocystis parvus]|uniref:hypothetical protein n=1 Tax=Methylocystis parvus TaxID=134 RepID=UPI003C71CF32
MRHIIASSSYLFDGFKCVDTLYREAGGYVLRETSEDPESPEEWSGYTSDDATHFLSHAPDVIFHKPVVVAFERGPS